LYKISKEYGTPSEISELNKNDAGFKEKSENPRSIDQSNWHGKRLQTRWCTVYNTAQYCTGEGDKKYTDQSEWNNF